jgi:hypothetical protein
MRLKARIVSSTNNNFTLTSTLMSNLALNLRKIEFYE